MSHQYSSATKGPTKSFVSSVNIESNNLLLKPIQINSNQQLVGEYIIQQYLSKNRFENNMFYSDVGNIMANDSTFSGVSSCAFLMIGNFGSDEFAQSPDFYISNPLIYENVFFYIKMLVIK